MTITAHVHNHSIALPAGIEVLEGTEVRVMLPPGPVASDRERGAWLAQSEHRSLAGWNPNADEVYKRLFTPSPDVDTLNGMEAKITPSEQPVPAAESNGVTSWMLKYAGTINGPSDFAAEHDHYIYGTPKRSATVDPSDSPEHPAIMSIIATVENDSIKLPPGVHVPDGTQAKVIFVPEPDRTLAERYASLIGFADDLPADMAENHDHYLHGHAKK